MGIPILERRNRLIETRPKTVLELEPSPQMIPTPIIIQLYLQDSFIPKYGYSPHVLPSKINSTTLTTPWVLPSRLLRLVAPLSPSPMSGTSGSRSSDFPGNIFFISAEYRDTASLRTVHVGPEMRKRKSSPVMRMRGRYVSLPEEKQAGSGHGLPDVGGSWRITGILSHIIGGRGGTVTKIKNKMNGKTHAVTNVYFKNYDDGQLYDKNWEYAQIIGNVRPAS